MRQISNAIVVCLVVTFFGCASVSRNASIANGVPIVLDYEIASKDSAFHEGDEIRVQNVITNKSRRMISGCLAPFYEYEFVGSKTSKDWIRLVIDMECMPDTVFRLAPHQQFIWQETILIPEIGIGSAMVTGIVDVVVWGEANTINLQSNMLELVILESSRRITRR